MFHSQTEAVSAEINVPSFGENASVRTGNRWPSKTGFSVAVSTSQSRTFFHCARARVLLSRAAQANSAEAQYQLALMVAGGVGGPQDDVSARSWFEKAAVQGHPRALLWLGVFAETGRGGPQDTSAAKAYYEKAAALGIEEARAALKRMECSWVVKDKQGNVVTTLCF